ncbi:BgTH12-06172 [Blumeria graminis f. sp. triticale]|uniref:Bgt-2791 n=3 Tax=Blumeria graminis TaxID=34373 RepID=A0A061HJM0_BLUGR|nr:hypothetical protein BGT96224_2791 [Blumeria graminis f. sp. tritici 96224]CAD6504442.1 BgTH12-06172 [Blumeria graminis f. sp. triticale]VDB91315.1 Bgt-2791 [Blumeria graminis f. sp. tritici]
MDSSPLALAYDHARAASVATQSSETTIAINEHTLAAAEFSNATAGTKSIEALRVLRLLEQHHLRLSELLRTPSNTPSPNAEPESQTATEKDQISFSKTVVVQTLNSDQDLQSSSSLRSLPALPHPRRLPPRDLSSSIASNLASARGIRSRNARQSLCPSISIHQTPGSLEALSRRDSKQKKVHSVPRNGDQVSRRVTKNSIKNEINIEARYSDQSSKSDEGFRRFYNTFENILSRISAPLAFTGLPLINEGTITGDCPSESSQLTKMRNSTLDQNQIDEIDLSKYFSRASLRASSRDDLVTNDSFCVVPATSRNVSYAHIMSFDEKEKRRMAINTHVKDTKVVEDLGDGVVIDVGDAPRLTGSKGSLETKPRLSAKERDNKLEELTTENHSLKTAIDKLSRRLHAFEISAQQNSMALAESMRLMRDISPAQKDLAQGIITNGIIEDNSFHRRVQELEEQVRLGGREIVCLRRENEKLRNVVSRYRERWDKLKEGAKSRRDGKELTPTEPTT